MACTANLHEKPGLFGRFNAFWTPTILVLSDRGAELRRIEGYLPRELYVTELKLGLAKAEFASKRFVEAEQSYGRIASDGKRYADEATYWRGVSRYSGSQEATPLREVSEELCARFPESVWTLKASVWQPR